MPEHKIAVLIKEKLHSLSTMLDEEHLEVLSHNKSYAKWRSTMRRLLKHYALHIRQAERLKLTGEVSETEAETLLLMIKSERSAARQKVVMIRTRIAGNKLLENK